MSAEDDDLAWIRSELDQLSRDAKSLDDLGAVIVDHLAARYDDRIAAERVATNAARLTWKQRVSLVFRRGVIPDARTALCSAFVDSLFARRVITKQQLSVASVFGIVRFADDGRTEVVLPSAAAFRRARIMMMVLSVPSVIALWLAWEVFSASLVGMAISWTMGSLLGWVGRDIYDSAWGRARIAEALASRYRWLVPRVSD